MTSRSINTNRCFNVLDIQKIKSEAVFRAYFEHNFRLKEVENADPALTPLNEELIRIDMDSNGTRLSYYKSFQKRIRELPYYQNHSIRKNGVYGLSVVISFSREAAAAINIKSWKEKSIGWLEKNFNVAPDGKSNIISAVYHADEPGNVHCHAIIIPIDERGRLNASRFTDWPVKLSEFHSTLAQEMEDLGLVRGIPNSHAKHKTIHKLYGELDKALSDIPQPFEGENAFTYRQRALNELQTAWLVNKKRIDNEKRAAIEFQSGLSNLEREAIQKEYDSAAIEMEEHIASLRQMESSLQHKIKILKETEQHMTQSLQWLDQENLEEIQMKLIKYEDLCKKMEFLQQNYPELSEELEQIFSKTENVFSQEIQTKDKTRHNPWRS